MADKIKVLARTVETREIGEISGPVDALPQAFADILKKASDDGSIANLAGRPILPPFLVQVVGDETGFGGKPEIKGSAIFGAAGQALGSRDFRVSPATSGFLLEISRDTEIWDPLGVIIDEDVAQMIGQMWRNGYLD